jgi:hypothetical protein
MSLLCSRGHFLPVVCRSFMRSIIALTMAAFCSLHALASEDLETEALPIEVQVDLYMAELTRLLEFEDNVGIVNLVPKIRALNINIPNALYFIEARALYATGDAIQARESLLVYLNQAGREGRYYQEATNLLLEVRALAAEKEARNAELLAARKQAQELAEEKARTLRNREVQSLLFQVGFPKTPVTGEIDGLTREALAVFQVRQGLTVNAEINQKTLTKLRAAVPSSLTCDTLANRPFAPGDYIKINDIDYQNAVPACNEAIRDYPVAARLHIQYARALIAAGRASDAERAIREHVEIGYPGAMHVMAELYREEGLGEDGKADYETVESWLLRAAERRDYMAQMDLYRLYANGAAGIRKNLALATRWLATASDLDHIPASFLLGQHYERGQGLARNYEQAADLYQKASDKDHLAATLALANLYERGRGVEKDQDQALVLLIKAQSLGAEALERRIARLKKKRSS